jgi:hypothetical protein
MIVGRLALAVEKLFQPHCALTGCFGVRLVADFLDHCAKKIVERLSASRQSLG